MTPQHADIDAAWAGRLRAGAVRVWYSFPVQLIGLHLRQNHLLLALWTLLALFVADALGTKFGIKYLFLEPEYGGRVGPLSFFVVGLGLGGLVMTWNLTTYLLTARYFPFLATLARPFSKFCINNAAVPLAFLAFYVWRLRAFLRSELAYGGGQLISATAALLAGVAVVIICYVAYFRLTNRDIASYPALGDLLRGRAHPARRPVPPGHRGVDVERVLSGERAWRVDVYLTERLRPRRTRAIGHYSPRLLLRVFRQNHLNALVLQGLILGLLVVAGLGIDHSWARVPAGASLLVIFSVVAAVAGAVTYWFHAWRTTIFLVALLAVNFYTGRDWFTYRNRAYGMDYSAPLPAYSYNRLVELAAPAAVGEDRDSMRAVLERWHARTGQERPRMVLLCVSGGGLKATYWTTHVLQRAQRATGGRLVPHTTLISGASGGMIGAAYFRELAFRQNRLRDADRRAGTGAAGRTQEPPPPPDADWGAATLPPVVDATDPRWLEPTGRDLLNSVGFALLTRDLLPTVGTFEHAGQHYRKDRAYAFESQLHENLGGALAKPLSAYEAPERAAEIPMLLLTPSVVNDARRLIISPLGVRHLTIPPAGVGRTAEFEVDAVDFQALFAGTHPERIGFATALRMNATYPYILPNVYLPSEPPVEVMDAGFRDNFGVLEAGRFLQVYREWILANTSGVALVQVSTFDKFAVDEDPQPQGWISSLFNPLGVAAQMISLQDLQTDETVGLLSDLFGAEHFDFVRFAYVPAADREAASMTFHLTAGEKADIRASIDHPDNVAAMEKLQRLLGDTTPVGALLGDGG